MDPLRRIAPGTYFVSALLFLITSVDYLGNAWPFRPGEVDWRYGAVGMISLYLLSPLLGCVIASTLAAWLPQPRVSKILGLLMWIGALFLLGALGFFVLDSIQVRSAATEGQRWVTTTSFLLASAKILLAAIGLMILGRGNFKAAAANALSSGSRKREPTRPVIGQS